MTTVKDLDIKRVVVFGGTGAQGSQIVKQLSKPGNFTITIPTRDPTSKVAISISNIPNAHLIKANYETETGLRAAFANQDACYFNLNSFALSEPNELFWSFRAYEIAVQSHLKLFVLSGGPDRLKQHNYEEKYRNSHGTVSARVSDWLSHQPLDVFPWVITTGGVYAEMLGSVLLPRKREDGVFEFLAPIGEGSIPFVPLESYGTLARWVFENSEKCVGRWINWPPWFTTYPDLVKTFEEATGKKATWRDVTQEQWFEVISAYVDPEEMLPKGSAKDDPTAFSFRRTFGAWWNLWKDNIRDLEKEKANEAWADEVDPQRLTSLEEWMKRSGYTELTAALQMSFEKTRPSYSEESSKL